MVSKSIKLNIKPTDEMIVGGFRFNITMMNLYLVARSRDNVNFLRVEGDNELACYVGCVYVCFRYEKPFIPTSDQICAQVGSECIEMDVADGEDMNLWFDKAVGKIAEAMEDKSLVTRPNPAETITYARGQKKWLVVRCSGVNGLYDGSYALCGDTETAVEMYRQWLNSLSPNFTYMSSGKEWKGLNFLHFVRFEEDNFCQDSKFYGVIELEEWLRAFGADSGSLDMAALDAAFEDFWEKVL